MGKVEHFRKWIFRRDAKKYARRYGLNPASMFKVVSDYGWGDRSESEPMSFYEAIAEFQRQRPKNAFGYQGMFDSSFTTHIEECSYGWH